MPVNRNLLTIYIRLLLASAFLMGLFGGSALAEDDISVRFKEHSSIKGEKVLLKDMAVISGPDCALKNDLAETFITRSPAPGETTQVRTSYLEHRLLGTGLPLNEIKWHVPGEISVSRESQTITKEWIRDEVLEYLAGIEPYRSSEWELIGLKTGVLPTLPAGELDHRIQTTPSQRTTSPRLTLKLFVDGKEVEQIRLQAKVEIKAKAIVAIRRLEKKAVVSPDDFKVEKISLDKIPKGALTDISQTQGKSVRQRLQAGDVVLARDLVLVPVVRKGDLVTIVAQSATVKVTAPGQVKRDGVVGDNVPVLNITSKKMLMAEVLTSNQVLVHY